MGEQFQRSALCTAKKSSSKAPTKCGGMVPGRRAAYADALV